MLMPDGQQLYKNANDLGDRSLAELGERHLCEQTLESGLFD